MSTLIPECDFEDFVKIVADGKTEELKAVEVFSEGKYLFTAIIPHSDAQTKDYIRTRAEYLAMKANIGGGVDPAIFLKGNTCSCGFEAKSPFGLQSHKRKHKEKELAIA